MPDGADVKAGDVLFVIDPRPFRVALDSAKAQLLGYTTVRSPVTGRMGRAEVRVGSLVGRNEATLLATVSTLDPMYVNFSVSEREALQVSRRRQAEMQALYKALGGGWAEPRPS